MKLLIHDYTPEEFAPLAAQYAGWDIVSDDGSIRPCIGCFGCWIKTPGQCVIPDAYQTMARRIHAAEEVVVCTKWTYGGFSPFVKNVFDRSIGVVLPLPLCRGRVPQPAGRGEGRHVRRDPRSRAEAGR